MEREPIEFFSVEAASGSPEFWETHRREILDLHTATVGRLYVSNMLVREHERIQNNLSAPSTVAALLIRGKGKLVGLSYAYPPHMASQQRVKHYLEHVKSPEDVNEEDIADLIGQTYEVGWSIIHPKYQRHGGWTQLMNVLDPLIRQHAAYQVRTTRNEGGLSDRIRRRYKPPYAEIVFEEPAIHPQLGDQTGFVIKVS